MPKSSAPPKSGSSAEKYAEKFVGIQSEQMKNLGTTGDYANPYPTMKPDYEGATLEVFADLVEKGIVYRDLKPVHWSIANQTALADAELEYFDRKDTSIFVRFNLVDTGALPSGLNIPAGETVSVMIWTTTPWTLPANLAVAVAPEERYGLYRYTQSGQTYLTILDEGLSEKVLQSTETSDVRPSASLVRNSLEPSLAISIHLSKERPHRCR